MQTPLNLVGSAAEVAATYGAFGETRLLAFVKPAPGSLFDGLRLHAEPAESALGELEHLLKENVDE